LENGGKVGIVAFADNIALLNSTPEGLENTWKMLAQFCADSGLRIKASKSTHTTNDRNYTFTPTTNKGDQLVRLRPDEVYMYLGFHMRLDLNQHHIRAADKKFNKTC